VFSDCLDSGTETDDEGEDNFEEDSTPTNLDHPINLPIKGMDPSQLASTSHTSSESMAQRQISPSHHTHRRHITGTPISAMRALGIQDAQSSMTSNKENIEPPHESQSQSNVSGAPVTVQIQDFQSEEASPFHLLPPLALDGMDGNHSSEEELEEINKFDEPMPSSSDTPISDTRTPSTIPFCETPMQSNSSSGDETMENGRALTATPVQFSMSPPTGMHVHKPRRSSSPPSKIFLGECHASQPSPLEEAGLSPSYAGDALSEKSEDRRDRRRTISPRKRYRHGRQRPCLDFEKMQQLKTRAVTSWRHGGELSLFCW
ncbi:hypothetical protein TCAL_06623, partial [Tigriopus californicus]